MPKIRLANIIAKSWHFIFGSGARLVRAGARLIRAGATWCVCGHRDQLEQRVRLECAIETLSPATLLLDNWEEHEERAKDELWQSELTLIMALFLGRLASVETVGWGWNSLAFQFSELPDAIAWNCDCGWDWGRANDFRTEYCDRCWDGQEVDEGGEPSAAKNASVIVSNLLGADDRWLLQDVWRCIRCASLRNRIDDWPLDDIPELWAVRWVRLRVGGGIWADLVDWLLFLNER